jgi:FdhD protein
MSRMADEGNEPQAASGDEPQQASSLEILRIKAGEREKIAEHVVSEHTLVVIAADTVVARMQYLPGQDKELVAGFLVGEGLVEGGLAAARSLEIKIARPEPSVTEAKVLSEVDRAKIEAFMAKASMASGCGAAPAAFAVDPFDCGRRIDMAFRAEAAVVTDAMRRFNRRSELFKLTGAVHSAAVVDAKGHEVAFADDIGRHNALDKVIGHCALRGIALADKIVLVSGRLSAELAAKCARSGVALAASPGAATDLAIRIAKVMKLTLVGFARGDRMNVYTAEWRML